MPRRSNSSSGPRVAITVRIDARLKDKLTRLGKKWKYANMSATVEAILTQYTEK